MSATTIEIPTKWHNTARNTARGIIGMVGVLGISLFAATAPMMSEVPQQIGSWGNYTITESARSVYVHAMLRDGWVVVPMDVADDS